MIENKDVVLEEAKVENNIPKHIPRHMRRKFVKRFNLPTFSKQFDSYAKEKLKKV